jgi:hypothetical protein
MTGSDIFMDKHIISKKRVADHGEVYTRAREVNAMLDLVKQETERIESRFLEPACGTGNFLAEILERKLRVVKARYRKSQLEYERNAVLAISSIYGIDILEDNIENCRKRLYNIFDQKYSALFNRKAKDDCRNAVRHILSRNIVCGDALSMKTVGGTPKPIVFSEWSPLNGSILKRRDYMLSYLLTKQHQMVLFSDEGDLADINEPVKEYPATHFLKVGDIEK